MNNAEDQYLTAGQVADRLHVSTKTVHRWAEQGMLPCTYTLGGHRRFRLRDVEIAIAESEEGRDGLHAKNGDGPLAADEETPGYEEQDAAVEEEQDPAAKQEDPAP